MVGYLVKTKEAGEHYTFFASWKELLEALNSWLPPIYGYDIETCIYYEGDLKEKNDD